MDFTPIKRMEDVCCNYTYTMGDNFQEEQIFDLFKDDGNLLERIITKIANGTIDCMEPDMSPITSLLSEDMYHIMTDYLKLNKQSIEKDNLETVQIKDFTLPDKFKKFVSTAYLKTKIDEFGSKFDVLCADAVILIPYILEKFPNATYEELFPTLNRHLMEDTIKVECLVEANPVSQYLNRLFAPTESELDDCLDEQRKKVNILKEQFHSLMEKIGFEKSMVAPESSLYSESFKYSLDVVSDGLVNLNLRNRQILNSADIINKNSVKAVPTRLEIIEDSRCDFIRASKKDKKEYSGHASGKGYNYETFCIRFAVEFRLRHPVVATKRLLINKGKSYKTFESSSISIALNTIRTMIEMPGHMIAGLSSEDPNAYDVQIILKNLDFSRDNNSDADIKKGISEHLRNQWNKFGAYQLFDFIRVMNNLNDLNKNKRGIISSNVRFNKGGIHSIVIEHDSAVPESLNKILENLKDIQEFFGNVAEEAGIACKYLEEKFKDLKINPNSKMSYRELAIKILTNEIKTDPLALLTKNSDYIQNIAKEFI